MSSSDNVWDDITTALAHEIKNPISLILANISVLRMLDTENLYAKYFSIMEREVHKVNSLVNSLISLSVGTARFTRVEMNGLISAIVEDRNKSYSGSPEISVNLTQEEQVIRGDKQSLEIALSNILKNAKESIEVAAEDSKEPDFFGKVEISATRITDNGHAILRITVDDNGIGLSDPDEVNNTGYTTKQGGSGIGLTVCRSIIKLHNGTFTLTPREKAGCRAELMLPIIE